MITDATETLYQQKLHPGALCAIHPDAPFDFSEKAYLLPRDVALKAFVDQWLHIADATGALAALKAKARAGVASPPAARRLDGRAGRPRLLPGRRGEDWSDPVRRRARRRWARLRRRRGVRDAAAARRRPGADRNDPAKPRPSRARRRGRASPRRAARPAAAGPGDHQLRFDGRRGQRAAGDRRVAGDGPRAGRGRGFRRDRQRAGRQHRHAVDRLGRRHGGGGAGRRTRTGGPGCSTPSASARRASATRRRAACWR